MIITRVENSKPLGPLFPSRPDQQVRLDKLPREIRFSRVALHCPKCAYRMVESQWRWLQAY